MVQLPWLLVQVVFVDWTSSGGCVPTYEPPPPPPPDDESDITDEEAESLPPTYDNQGRRPAGEGATSRTASDNSSLPPSEVGLAADRVTANRSTVTHQ